MEGIEVIDTGRGWGVLETSARGFIRFIEGRPIELFSSAARAWGLAHYAQQTYGHARAAEQRIPAWTLDALPPLDVVMAEARDDVEQAGMRYAEVLHGLLSEYARVCELVLSHAGAARAELPAPLIGARDDLAVALCYDAHGPALATRERIERALRLARAAGYTRVLGYARTAARRRRNVGWQGVAVAEAERALVRRREERARIVLDVAQQLPGFRYLGEQLSEVLVGLDDHGAVGVIWRERAGEIAQAEWAQAAAEATQLGLGPGLTLLGTETAAVLDAEWRFVRVAKRSERWVALTGPEEL